MICGMFRTCIAESLVIAFKVSFLPNKERTRIKGWRQIKDTLEYPHKHKTLIAAMPSFQFIAWNDIIKMFPKYLRFFPSRCRIYCMCLGLVNGTLGQWENVHFTCINLLSIQAHIVELLHRYHTCHSSNGTGSYLIHVVASRSRIKMPAWKTKGFARAVGEHLECWILDWMVSASWVIAASIHKKVCCQGRFSSTEYLDESWILDGERAKGIAGLIRKSIALEDRDVLVNWRITLWVKCIT